MCWINTKKATCECPFSLLHPLKPRTEWFLRQYQQTSKKTPFIPPREREIERIFSPSCVRSFFSTVEKPLLTQPTFARDICLHSLSLSGFHAFRYIPGAFSATAKWNFFTPPPPPTLYRGPPLNFVSNRVKWIFRKEMNIEIPDIHSPSLSTCEWVLIEI